MFYMNPYYTNYLDAYNKATYTMSIADNISLKSYIKCTKAGNADSQFCEKLVDSKDIYLKYAFYFIESSNSTDYRAEMRVLVEDTSGKKETLYIFDPQGYYHRSCVGANDVSRGYWCDACWHFYFETKDDGKKHLCFKGIVGAKSYDGYVSTIFDDPKIVSIQFAGYQHLRDIVIADFPLHINDEIIELPITAHAGDFVDQGDGKYDLLEAEKVGTATIDTSGVKTENTRLVAVSYMSSMERNNDDITGVEISYAGNKDLHALQDGSNVVVASFEGDAINREALSSLTVTAKKV